MNGFAPGSSGRRGGWRSITCAAANAASSVNSCMPRAALAAQTISPRPRSVRHSCGPQLTRCLKSPHRRCACGHGRTRHAPRRRVAWRASTVKSRLFMARRKLKEHLDARSRTTRCSRLNCRRISRRGAHHHRCRTRAVFVAPLVATDARRNGKSGSGDRRALGRR